MAHANTDEQTAPGILFWLFSFFKGALPSICLSALLLSSAYSFDRHKVSPVYFNLIPDGEEEAEEGEGNAVYLNECRHTLCTVNTCTQP